MSLPANLQTLTAAELVQALRVACRNKNIAEIDRVTRELRVRCIRVDNRTYHWARSVKEQQC